MLKDIKVGFLNAKSSIKRGHRKTTLFIIFVLSLIFVNLVFLPSLINGMMGLFVGFVQDYAYGNIVIEPMEGNSYINNAEDVLLKVRSIDGVKAVAKRLEAGATIKYNQKEVGVNMQGLIPVEEESVSRYPYIVTHGEFLGEYSRDEITIGAMIAGKGFGSEIYDNLGDIEIGSLVNVTYSNGVEKVYKIRGVHEGTFELTDLNALAHYKEVESVLGLTDGSKATSIVIKLYEGVKESEIKEKILDLGIKERVYTWQEKSEVLIKQALQSIGALDIMSKIVSLIVGASLIFIVIYINTLNRKREIGIQRAIGVSSYSIRISYIFVSLFYTLAGIILGLIIFLVLVSYLKSNPIVFYETLKISPIINFGLLFQSIGIMLGMAIVAGFLPAWFVTRQNILNAIWGNS